jgi:uncharacterized protein
MDWGARVKTYVWRGLDGPRMEIAYVDDPGHARGTQIGLSYELRWELDGERLDLEVVGGRRERFELGGADFFDVHHSPFFNSLPVLRDGLLEEPGPSRHYTMNFIEVPQLTATLLAQTYEPLGKRTVRYSSGTFQADIEFDLDGIVSSYSDYLERVAPESATNTGAAGS